MYSRLLAVLAASACCGITVRGAELWFAPRTLTDCPEADAHRPAPLCAARIAALLQRTAQLLGVTAEQLVATERPLTLGIVARGSERGFVLAGKLSLLGTASLMSRARMNYVNDSAPLHIASAMNAPVTVVFCSTVPAFGFGPLRENGRVIETSEKLRCRPCGVHGYKACPEGHFKCALTIDPEDVARTNP